MSAQIGFRTSTPRPAARAAAALLVTVAVVTFRFAMSTPVTRLSASGARVYRMDQERFRVAAIATPRSQLFFVSDVSRPVPYDSDTLLTLGVEFVRTALR